MKVAETVPGAWHFEHHPVARDLQFGMSKWMEGLRREEDYALSVANVKSSYQRKRSNREKVYYYRDRVLAAKLTESGSARAFIIKMSHHYLSKV